MCIIAAFNCVALAEAGDSWCTLPAASLGASASQLQLKYAADRAAQWAAAGQRHNTLVRYLAESVVRVIVTDRGVQRVTTGSVDVLLFPKDLLLKVILDVHHGGPLHCAVNNAGSTSAPLCTPSCRCNSGRRFSSRRKSITLTWALPTLAAKSTSCDYCIVLTRR